VTQPDVPPETPAHWRVYFAVEDADRTTAAARTGGGRVLTEPSDTPYGRMSVLADPQGATFVILGRVSSAQDAAEH
jgi:predicted enzyme related to lactoylglutathione lyase